MTGERFDAPNQEVVRETQPAPSEEGGGANPVAPPTPEPAAPATKPDPPKTPPKTPHAHPKPEGDTEAAA